ncbi:MAG: acyl--CoA ligase [Bacteroidaceae bacterium]|nr:acyl--CoA ligase [Bacteroidaceae bacterium]
MHCIEDYLNLWAEENPAKPAVICDGETLTYGQLWQQVKERSREYQQAEGSAVLVRNTQSIDFLIQYFATHLAGKAAVPVEEDCTPNRLGSIQHQINACTIPVDVADILYTTGTTGQQKGIMISHKAIVADAENLISTMQFTEDLLFIISGPLNHIGSLSKIWPTIMVGATLCITPGMKDMNLFLSAFRLPYPKVATFLVPTSIRMLLQFARKEFSGIADKIDFIETGAAPMAQADMEALCRLLPHTRLYNTYASTETGIICTHNYNSDYCVAGCLGRPMLHSSVFITPEGNVACQGATLMEGYVGDEGLTRNVLHDGTLFTSDCGRIDEQGRLHLTGRMGDIINIGGYKVNPIEVEDAALSFPAVGDCICTPSPHPVLGTVLRLFVVPKDDKTIDKKELAAHLTQKLEHYKVPQLFSITDHIERTYNGKLNRKFYL